MIGGLLTPLSPNPSPRAYLTGNAAHNLLHLPAFVLITCALFFGLRLKLPWKKSTYWSAILATLIAAATELTQPFIERTASLQDFIANVLGITAGLAFLSAIRYRKKIRPILFSIAVILLCTFATFVPYYQYVQSDLRQHKSFPSLGNFQQPDALFFWRGRLSNSEPSSNLSIENNHLRVRTTSEDWGGVHYIARWEDWTPFHGLRIELINHGEPFELGIRIDGEGNHQKASRLQTSIQLTRGEQNLFIPFNQNLGSKSQCDVILKRVSRLVIHNKQSGSKQDFTLKTVTLSER